MPLSPTRTSGKTGLRIGVTGLAGDAFNRELLPLTQFDRAIIPTPYGRDDIFGVIASHVKSGGIIHFYTFKNREQSSMLEKEFEKMGYCVLARHRCGNVAPAVSRWVFDLLIP